MSKNDITGDEIKSKVNSKEYETNFDQIFRKDKLASTTTTSDKPLERSEEWDEKRLDIIGSNGNEGLHYANMDDAYERVENDYADKP